MKTDDEFHPKLKKLINDYILTIYEKSKTFPRDEMYGLTSQLRRSALSIMLNYIEGYARQRNKVLKNFIEISYGSLKESKYLTYLAHKQHYLNQKNYQNLTKIADKIGAMLWGILKNIKI